MITLSGLWGIFYAEVIITIGLLLIGVILLWFTLASKSEIHYVAAAFGFGCLLLASALGWTATNEKPQVLIREALPGTYIDQNGGLVPIESIPIGENLPGVYDVSPFDGATFRATGFVRQGSTWYLLFTTKDHPKYLPKRKVDSDAGV